MNLVATVHDTIKKALISKGVTATVADRRARDLCNDGMAVLRESLLAAARANSPPDLYQCQLTARTTLSAWVNTVNP